MPGDPNTIPPSMQPASQYGDIQGVTADSVMAAASAAARINAQLVAKGFGTKVHSSYHHLLSLITYSAPSTLCSLSSMIASHHIIMYLVSFRKQSLET